MGYIITSLLLICSWLTHVIHCFNEEAWGFLIAGAILAPIAVIHGVYLWFSWLF